MERKTYDLIQKVDGALIITTNDGSFDYSIEGQKFLKQGIKVPKAIKSSEIVYRRIDPQRLACDKL